MILIAERDQSVRALERHFLERAGFQVEFADHGLDLLERVQSARPAVIVTEILIPKLDGLALCRRLKSGAETQTAAVLVVSILAARVRAEEAGADAFLLKPISEGRLVAAVEALLAKEKMRDQVRNV